MAESPGGVPATEPTSAEIFAAYHRVDRRRAVVRIVVGSLISVAAVGAIAAVVGSSPIAVAGGTGIPSPSPSGLAVSPAPTMSADPATPDPTATVEVLPQPEPANVPVATPLPVTAGPWTIRVNATGYQTELDQCLWVRMELGAVAPIVGAHRSCGGAIVLDMVIGDQVTVSGQGLDGNYVVTESRQAHAGDVAATATAGMTADVILQTCYPGSDGRERLVSLLRTA